MILSNMPAKSLQVSPNGTLTFTQTNNRQEVTIRNVSEKPVTYKVMYFLTRG